MGNTATASGAGCTFTSKSVGIPGDPFLVNTVTSLIELIVVPVLVAGHCKLNNVKKPDEKIKRQENMHLSNENPII